MAADTTSGASAMLGRGLTMSCTSWSPAQMKSISTITCIHLLAHTLHEAVMHCQCAQLQTDAGSRSLVSCTQLCSAASIATMLEQWVVLDSVHESAGCLMLLISSVSSPICKRAAETDACYMAHLVLDGITLVHLDAICLRRLGAQVKPTLTARSVGDQQPKLRLLPLMTVDDSPLRS